MDPSLLTLEQRKLGDFIFAPTSANLFKKKQPVTQVSFLRNQKSNEIITYCQKCRKEIRSF